MKLYELTEAYQRLLDLAADGEDFQASLDELRGSIQEKAEAVAMVIKTLEAESDVIEAESKRLHDKAAAPRNSANRLKVYLKAGLEAVGMETVKGRILTVALQKNPPSVTVLYWKDVPIEYVEGKPDTIPWATVMELGLQAQPIVDKQRILEDFKASGVVIPGVEIVQGRSLRIR